MTKNTRIRVRTVTQAKTAMTERNSSPKTEAPTRRIPRPEIKVRIRQETRPHPAVSAMRTMKRTRILNNMF